MPEVKPATASPKNRPFLLLLVLALIVAVVAAAIGFAGKDETAKQNSELTAQQLERLTATNQELAEKLAQSDATLAAKAAELEDVQTEQKAAAEAGDALATQVAELAAAQTELSDQTALVQTVLTDVAAERDALTAEKAALDTQVAQLAAANAALETQRTETAAAKAEIDAQITQLSQTKTELETQVADLTAAKEAAEKTAAEAAAKAAAEAKAAEEAARAAEEAKAAEEAAAQSAGAYARYTDPADRYSFEYPADWTLLSKETADTLLAVAAENGDEQLQAMMEIVRPQLETMDVVMVANAASASNVNVLYQPVGVELSNELLLTVVQSGVSESSEMVNDFEMLQEVAACELPCGGAVRLASRYTISGVSLVNMQAFIAKDDGVYTVTLTTRAAQAESEREMFEHLLNTLQLN